MLYKINSINKLWSLFNNKKNLERKNEEDIDLIHKADKSTVLENE